MLKIQDLSWKDLHLSRLNMHTKHICELVALKNALCCITMTSQPRQCFLCNFLFHGNKNTFQYFKAFITLKLHISQPHDCYHHIPWNLYLSQPNDQLIISVFL